MAGDFGDDVIDGGAGNDFISGGAGIDTLTGGAGADLFEIFDYSNNAFADTITDFETGDVIRLFQGFDGTNSILPTFIGTCLLYTSPSPRDRTRSRMPSSA